MKIKLTHDMVLNNYEFSAVFINEVIKIMSVRNLISNASNYAQSSGAAKAPEPVKSLSQTLMPSRTIKAASSADDKDYVSAASFKIFQNRVAKMYGISHIARADKEDKAAHYANTYGPNTQQVLTILRSMIPWISFTRPTLKTQQEFLDYLESIVCGDAFKKGGLMAPGFWNEVIGASKGKGKSGSFANNSWKSYTEHSVSMWNLLHAELCNPAWIGAAACNPHPLCMSTLTDSLSMYRTAIMNNRAYFMNVLCVVGWNEKDNLLIFQPQYDMASPQSVMQHFLALISNLSDGALTIGTSPVFTLCLLMFLRRILCFTLYTLCS